MIISSSKGKSVRDMIIQILTDDWPLSMRKIYARVRRQHPVTYHAVYKTVKQMVKEGVLQEKDKEYFINKEWIKQMVKFGETLTSAYSRKSSKEPNTLVFDTVAEADNYLMSLEPQENQKKFVQCHHLWWALFRPETAFTRMQRDKIYNNETYVICNGSTVVDKWCGQFEGKIGKYIKLGVDCAKNCDIFVYGDVVLEVYYPRILVELIEGVYNGVKRIDDINLKALLKNFYRKQSEIIIVVNKNRMVAERIKQETLVHFS